MSPELTNLARLCSIVCMPMLLLVCIMLFIWAVLASFMQLRTAGFDIKIYVAHTRPPPYLGMSCCEQIPTNTVPS